MRFRVHVLYLLIITLRSVFCQTRIRNGEKAVPGQFKYVVAIDLEVISGNITIESACTGSIISPVWVLTAGHCVKLHYARSLLLNKHDVHIYVHAGTVDKATRVEGKTQDRNVTDIQIPPGALKLNSTEIERYKRMKIETAYSLLGKHIRSNIDMALLRVDRPFVFNEWVGVIAVDRSYPEENVIKYCVAVGFGRVQDIKDGNTFLHYIILKVKGAKDCMATATLKVAIQSHEVCGFHDGDTDVCSGDSGGPLICGTGRETIVGVMSYDFDGDGACYLKEKKKDKPEVYLFPGKFMDWINEITKDQVEFVRRDEVVAPSVGIGKRLLPEPWVCGSVLAFAASRLV